MLLEVLTFISANKAVITGSVACVGEVVVIILNLRRKYKAEAAKTIRVPIPNKNWEVTMTETTIEPAWRKVLWAANPINLFRKP